MAKLTHFDSDGSARMVDVSAKSETHRTAVASALIEAQPETLTLIRNHGIRKGDVFSISRIAGIMGAKKTSDLVPLCHPLRLDGVELFFENLSDRQVRIRSIVTATDRTGVEMEALTAVAVAGLTIYDMCKSVDRSMKMTDLQLDQKSGGKSGNYVRAGQKQVTPTTKEPSQ
jgi:cyclic pyranopterin phosphate synthase